jgi:hypothetical protein
MKAPAEAKTEAAPALRSAQRWRAVLPWVVLGCGVAVVTVGLLALVRAPGGERSGGREARDGRLGVARLDGAAADPVMREEAELKDPTPLFLPTPLNAGARVGPAPLEAVPGSRFQDLPAKLVFGEGRVAVGMPAPAEVPGTLPVALRVGERGNPFRGLGEMDSVARPLPPRLAFLRVTESDGRSGVFEMTLPPDPRAPAGDWAPMTWTLAVTASGVVGALVPEVGSGSEEWDAYFRIYLSEAFPLGAWLRPGFYRAVVGP